MIDLHYHLQSLNNPASNSRINEREIWFNILKFLISGKSLEIFLLITYLIPQIHRRVYNHHLFMEGI